MIGLRAFKNKKRREYSQAPHGLGAGGWRRGREPGTPGLTCLLSRSGSGCASFLGSVSFLSPSFTRALSPFICP